MHAREKQIIRLPEGTKFNKNPTKNVRELIWCMRYLQTYYCSITQTTVFYHLMQNKTLVNTESQTIINIVSKTF